MCRMHNTKCINYISQTDKATVRLHDTEVPIEPVQINVQRAIELCAMSTVCELASCQVHIKSVDLYQVGQYNRASWTYIR